jgi:RNA polymerase sigma-70 factor, ECF subfamily
LLARLGRTTAAAAAYRAALALTANEAERAFLAGRLAAVSGSAQEVSAGPGRG